MVCTLNTQIRRLRPVSLKLRAFNSHVKAAFEAAGAEWVERLLRKHFEPGAVQAYGYAARTPKYLRKKARRVAAGTIPNLPLVWTDRLRQTVLGRPLAEFRIRASATANRQRVRVPVRFPHPLNPKNAGEVVRLNQPDVAQMRRRALAELSQRLRQTAGVENVSLRA